MGGHIYYWLILFKKFWSNFYIWKADNSICIMLQGMFNKMKLR